MIRRGEIYWVDWSPGRGHEQSGRRPALVIQNDLGNQFSATTIVAALTTRIRRPYPFHVEVSAIEGGLPDDSMVLLEQIQTIDSDRLQERIGALDSGRMIQVDRALMRSLGIGSLA
jgi:mRNA interferase MazF